MRCRESVRRGARELLYLSTFPWPTSDRPIAVHSCSVTNFSTAPQVICQLQATVVDEMALSVSGIMQMSR